MLGYDGSAIDWDKYLRDELTKNFQIQLEKEIYKMATPDQNDSFTFNYRSAFMMPVFTTSAEGTPRKYLRSDFIPVKIIYNDTTTVCYFKDGSKETVHCAEDEQFVKEVGVMSCIMKKLFNSRNDFKRLVNAGYVQPKKVEKKFKPTP